MKTNYGYQNIAAEKVLKDALNDNYVASILAACPGSGKTTISHIIINSYLKMFPSANIVVLTEGQDVLKKQYLSELENANVEITFRYGDLSDDNAQVRVGIPQSINRLKLNKIDLLIVDEAHNFFLAPMVQDIVKKYSPTHTILMTGSPTQYNLLNKTQQKKYAMYYIAANELKQNGVFSSVNMDVVKSISKKNAHKTIEAVMQHAISREDDISKMMVACPTIEYGKKVADYLKYTGRKVAISTSENDSDSVLIDDFKAGKYDVLVVVGRGILGFNDKNMTYLADLRSSANIDASYQLFARILRVHPNNTQKTYVRVADVDYNKQIFNLHKMVALMDKTIYKGFDGKNLKIQLG